MPFQPLTAPSEKHSFITNCALSILLPSLTNETLFDENCERLFGNVTSRTLSRMIVELETYETNQISTLTNLINTKLRAKLVAHIEANQAQYQAQFDSNEAFSARLDLLGRPESPSDAFEQNLLADFLNINIQMIDTLLPVINEGADAENILYFAKRQDIYMFYIDTNLLSQEMRHKLFPLIQNQVQQGNNNLIFQKAKSKNLLQQALNAASTHLDNLSTNAPIAQQPRDVELKPVNFEYALRYNAENELPVISTHFNKVKLTKVYRLSLLTLDGCTDHDMIYVKPTQNGIVYNLLTETGGNIQNNATTPTFISWQELDHAIQAPLTLEELKPYLPRIQEILIERGHLTLNQPQIGGVDSWAGPMTLSALAAGAGGGLSVGIVTMVGEMCIGAGVGFSAIPFAGIPLAILTFVGMMGAAIFGKHRAVEYEKTLDEVNQLIRHHSYEEAAQRLDAELNKWTFGTRNLFLTHQHSSLLHFFSAICAEHLNNPQKAYENYIKAYEFAIKVDKKQAALISKLQIIKVLKNGKPNNLPKVADHPAAFTKALHELTTDFKDGITAHYWHTITNLSHWLDYFRNRSIFDTTMSQEILRDANRFLLAKDFYIFKHFGDGYGAFFEVITSFYQGIILNYFSNLDPDFLFPEIKNRLVIDLLGNHPPDTHIERSLALKKFKQTAILLNAFKSTHPAMCNDARIRPIIQMMRTFILKYFATWVDGRNLPLDVFLEIASILEHVDATQNQLYNEIQFPINFLAQIHRDFNLCFEDEDKWLDEILKEPSQIAHLVSEQTGDTMLHQVARFKTANNALAQKQQRALVKLQEFRYQRNHQYELPCLTLQNNENQHLINIAYPDTVNIGNAVNDVHGFLKNSHRNPSKSKHFILLEGPPGTGKTETVLSYLRTQNYQITQWDYAQRDDKWVGGLLARVKEFFEKGKKLATQNPNKKYILLIDEINSVCSEREGNPDAGSFNARDVAEAFQIEVDNTSSFNNLILIGTTNFPELVARGMLSRAKRIIYDLPNLDDRYKVLQHIFKEKRIENSLIQRVATLTQGWSLRGLNEINSMIPVEQEHIDEHLLDIIFKKCSRVIEADFQKEFKHYAELSLPCFQHTPPENILNGFSVVNSAIRAQFELLSGYIRNPSYYFNEEGGLRLHVLLYGPPGGGKTTAIRKFTQNMNTTFVVVKAGMSVTALNALFLKVENFSSVVVCIDEIDKIAYDGSPVRELLQEKMDGLQRNNIIVVGATNYRERIPAPLLDRFEVAYVPSFSAEQVGQLVAGELRNQFASTENLRPDEDLQTEIDNGCINLATIAEGHSIRRITRKIATLFGNIRHQNVENQTPHVLVTLVEIQSVLQSLTTDQQINMQGLFGRQHPLFNFAQQAAAEFPGMENRRPGNY